MICMAFSLSLIPQLLVADMVQGVMIAEAMLVVRYLISAL
jgi:hypothetical protein